MDRDTALIVAASNLMAAAYGNELRTLPKQEVKKGVTAAVALARAIETEVRDTRKGL
jgi:hypothetical protein